MSPVSTWVTVLAHVLFGIDAVGVVLTIVLDAPHDTSLVGWRAPLLLFAALIVVVGWILAWKRPRIPIGWIMLGIAVLEAIQGPAAAIAVALRRSDPLAAGWAVEFGSQSSWTWIPALGGILILIPLRFPDGSLPSPRWRWFWWASIAAMVWAVMLAATFEPTMEFGVPNPTYLPRGKVVLGITELVSVLPVLAAMIGALASLFVRYRRSGPIGRAQLRWLFWALASAAGLLVVGGIENQIFGNEDSGGVPGLVAHIIDFGNTVTYSLIPLAILIAVLRSGLYAIDRIVSRTAAYAIVTIGVVVVYAAVVLLGSLVLPQSQSVGVALATLAAAAIFLPLLRWVRRRVDRRFNRAQYDAEKVVDAFGERIRTGIDPHSAGEDLISAVGIALQPSAIGIWRREDGR